MVLDLWTRKSDTGSVGVMSSCSCGRDGCLSIDSDGINGPKLESRLERIFNGRKVDSEWKLGKWIIHGPPKDKTLDEMDIRRLRM